MKELIERPEWGSTPADKDEEKERFKKALQNILQTAPWAGDEGHHQCLVEARLALGLPTLNPFSGTSTPPNHGYRFNRGR